MGRPRILFYCQHLLGVGHLTRSLALCRALVEKFDVVFVQGGPEIGRTLESSAFRHVRLSSLLMHEESNELYDPSGMRSAGCILADRAEQLDGLIREGPYDALITELFPFGRNKFKAEILRLIAAVKAVSPSCLVVSSIRDILVEKPDAVDRDARMAQLVRDHFGAVLVHSDPEVIRLDETFTQAPAIADRLHYTGFVTEGSEAVAAETVRRPEVLVSLGGGVVGAELVDSVLAVVPWIPGMCFRFVLGPYAPAKVRAAVEEAALAFGVGRVQAVPFLPNFQEALSSVALSVSLAGYNTVMNILCTRTPALVLPHRGNREQRLRAQRCEQMGLLRMLRPEDLEPLAMERTVAGALRFVPSDVPVNLNGAAATVGILNVLLAKSGRRG